MLRYLLLLCLLPILQSGMAQSEIQKLLDDWAVDDYFKHASVGVCVADAVDGTILGGHQAQTSLIPASNLKIVTTATALAVLGADFRFKTLLSYDGYIDAGGVLNGNLYLVGSGDPSLGSSEMEGTPGLSQLLENWRLAVQQAGIRQVTGRIIADDRGFSTAANGSHWQWLDMGNYYGCGAFGLNIHENLYFLRFRQNNQLGNTPRVVRVEPTVPGLQFHNEIKSAARGSGDNAYIYGAPYTYQRYLRGTIPVGSGLFTIKGSIPDPPLFAAQQLAAALESVGIICQRPPARQSQLESTPANESERQLLHTHQSPSLTAIIGRTNMRSVNLFAEALLRAIGYHQTGEGTAEAGLQVIYDFWEARDVDMTGVQLYDGSGMAPRNVFPAAFMVQLLSDVYQDQSLRETFMNSLPLAGRSGSLRNSLKGTAAEGRLRAKTGSLEQVRAYSGYVTNRGGRMLAFSILLNNYNGSSSPARKKLLQLMANLAQTEY